jgi:hypothetical protein
MKTTMTSALLALSISGFAGAAPSVPNPADQQVQTATGAARRISLDAGVRPNGHPQGPAECKPAPAADRNTLQVAILLDTSNSMDGLINQARTQLWRIVNEMAKAKRDGNPVTLQIAVYEYGNTQLRDGMTIRQVLPFTSDLDTVSKELFALTTSGGDEYCGAVIERSLAELKWGSVDNPKIIYVCGNEPFTQGPVDFRRVCPSALKRDVIVNTIHCGSQNDGVNGQWASGAALGGGVFSNITGDDRYVEIPTPYDRPLAELNVKLNSTYIAYGSGGGVGMSKQNAADSSNFASSVQGGYSRVEAKASRLYRNAEWDLVDAADAKDFDVAKVDKSTLPPELASKSNDELNALIAGRRAEREKVREEIRKLILERENYRVAELKKQASGTPGALLEDALLKSLREQCAKKGVSW